MVCKHMKQQDLYNEEACFFQKIDTCTINNKKCQGGEEICSKYEAVEEPKDEEKEPERKEEKKEVPEEPEKKEKKEEEEAA